MKKQTLKVEVNRIHKFEESGNLKGFADVTLNGLLVIKGLRVIDSKKGLFVAMPQSKAKDDKWYDIVYPATKEAREQIQGEVVKQYNNA